MHTTTIDAISIQMQSFLNCEEPRDFVLMLKRAGIDVVQLPDDFLNSSSWKGWIDALQCVRKTFGRKKSLWRSSVRSTSGL